MTPGPTIIRKCSDCGKLIAQHMIGSGNTFGARYWTDGKRDAPMFTDAPQLVKCHHCATLIWIAEQKKVGQIEQPWVDNGGFKDAQPYDAPSVRDYFTYLASGAYGKQKERYLRLQAWWAGNDMRRENNNASPLSDDEIANLRAFAKLLDEAVEDDRIMKAEVMRELGDFDEAMALLSRKYSRGLSSAVKIIKRLAEQKIPFVQELD